MLVNFKTNDIEKQNIIDAWAVQTVSNQLFANLNNQIISNGINSAEQTVKNRNSSQDNQSFYESPEKFKKIGAIKAQIHHIGNMPEKYKRRTKQNKGNVVHQTNKGLPFINIENANKTLANDTVFGYNFVDLKETLTSN